MAKAANRGFLGHEQAEWTRRIESELDNLRAASALALGGGVDPIIAVKLEVAMQGFRILRGYSTEGREVCGQRWRSRRSRRSDQAQGRALYVGAALATGQGDYTEARRMLEKSLVLRRGLGNPSDIAATLSTLSWVRLHEGDAAQAQRTRRRRSCSFASLEIGTERRSACSISAKLTANSPITRALVTTSRRRWRSLERSCTLSSRANVSGCWARSLWKRVTL